MSLQKGKKLAQFQNLKRWAIEESARRLRIMSGKLERLSAVREQILLYKIKKMRSGLLNSCRVFS
jgi:hypothetical protein